MQEWQYSRMAKKKDLHEEIQETDLEVEELDDNYDNEIVELSRTKDGLSVIDNDYLISNLNSENDILQKYIKQVSKYPMLTQQEEEELFDEYIDHGKQQAGQAIVLSHLRLVVKIALQYKNYGINIMDIIAEGNTGLMHALKKFDRSKKVRFSTYAILWVRACIQDFILKSWSMVKIGSTTLRKQLLFNLKSVKKLLHISQNTSNDTKNELLAKHFNITKTEIENITSSLSQRDSSLETPIKSGENITLLDTISENDGDYDNILADKDDKQYKMKIFRESLSILDERQREILIARYLNDKKATLEELSIKYNISKERIRQIEESAIKKLKDFAKHYDQ